MVSAAQIDCGQELAQVRILSIDSIRPSPENETLYRPVDPNDPEIIALAKSIKKNGIQEPLIVTRDGWIVSGHRRHCASNRVGLSQVPCRVLPFIKYDDHDRFMKLLRDCNLQRAKSYDEKLREEILSATPEEAYQALVAHRTVATIENWGLDALQLRGRKCRAKISAAKQPFLAAVQRVLQERRRFWPLSDRSIHYAILNFPPLRHASKPGSLYGNTVQSYKQLVDLLTRARLQGLIPMNAIADPTRPVRVWPVHRDVQTYIRSELDGFLKSYWRDLMQSQPYHIEIIGEKNTIEPIIRPVAERFTIPLTIGRGFCSLPPRFEIVQRFLKSGKDSLVLLILSDHDPDGEEIAHSLARSLRDDFEIDEVRPVKVGLTADQVVQFNLPPIIQAKKTSTNYRKFADQHGDNVFELEALAPDVLQRLLTEAIDQVLDTSAFNYELDQEKQDAVALNGTRRRVHQVVGGFSQNGEGTEG